MVETAVSTDNKANPTLFRNLFSATGRQMTDFIPYNTSTIDEDDIQAVADALRAGSLADDTRLEAFEEAIAAHCHARYAIFVSSGTAALHLACLAAGLGPGSEAIVSPISFVSTANAALMCGSSPLFTDVCNDTLNLDPEQAQRKITARTAALMPVHFAGHSADMPVLHAIAEQNHLAVIEDATHALGARRPDGNVGDCLYSDMTVFSTHSHKAIATGEGGVITTNRPALHNRLRQLRSHGITHSTGFLTRDEGDWYYEMQEMGYNYRPSAMQAALGLSQLRKLATFIARRREIAARYHRAFSTLPNLTVPAERSGHLASYPHYVVRMSGGTASTRRWVFDSLQQAQIGVNVHYLPVYLHPYYRDHFGYAPGLCPVAERFYQETLSLPCHPQMTDSQVEYVIANVQRVCLELYTLHAKAA